MKCITCLAFLLALHFASLAQDAVQKDSTGKSIRIKHNRPLSIVISLFNHSIATPFHKIVNSPIHPGVQAGIEGRYFENEQSKVFQTLNSGFFYNKYNGTGFYINTEVAYRYTTRYKLFAESFLGIGYLRLYHPTDIYKPTGEGVYEKARDKGFSSPIFSFAFGLGYSIRSSSSISFAPFTRYECMIQSRYNADFDAFPHAALHAGIRINKTRKP